MSFAVDADAYDAFMGRWSRQLSAQMADLAGVSGGMRAIDVGCGSGALTDELARRLGPAMVTAVDASPSLVAAMRRRLPAIDVRQAVAERLPFEDGSFDVALAQLVVHFMADPVAGLGEMRRITRGNGVIAACVWDHGGGQGPLRVFWDAARVIRPEVEDESRLPGTAEGQLVDLLTAAGIRQVTGAVLRATIEEPTFESWWAPFTRGVGPAGAFVERLDPGDRERLRRECQRRLPDEPIRMSAVAWAARGLA